MPVDKRSDDGEGVRIQPLRESDVWCESGREDRNSYPSRAGVRTEISRHTRVTPDTALLSESSGWNRVISAPLTLVRGVYFFIRIILTYYRKEDV